MRIKLFFMLVFSSMLVIPAIAQKTAPCSASLCAGVGCQATVVGCMPSIKPSQQKLFLCSNSYADQFALRSGKLETPRGQLLKPAKNAITTDINYASCIVRATDHVKEPPSGFARNDYSRRRAFNVDSSKFIVFAEDGFWHLYDVRTLAYERRLDGLAGDAEPQWHPSDASQLYYVPNNGGLELNVLNVETLVSKRVTDFSSKLPWPNAARVWSRSEGSPSADGRYWALLVETEGFQGLGLIVYDLQQDSIVSTWDLAQNGADRPDHLSMSPSGDFVVVSWSNGLGTRAYPRNFQSFQQLQAASEHSDIALLANGNDAYVSIDYGSANGDVFMIELQTAKRTVLFPTYLNGGATAMHFSGKAYQLPGWILVSTYAATGQSNWMSDKIFAVSLDATAKILNIAHHHSVFDGYWTEPHATVNSDFTRVLFNSNWLNKSPNDVDAYIIELPKGVVK